MGKPTYTQLVQKYYNAQRSVIGEFSGNIAKDTLALWRVCNSWLAEGERIEDTSMMIEEYEQWEKEGDL